MNIIGRRRIWFAISLLVIIPGTISLILWGLRPGIDFSGGQVMEIGKANDKQSSVKDVFEKAGVRDLTITTSGNDNLLARYRDAEGKTPSETNEVVKAELASIGAEQVAFESVGPSVSRDITRNAVVSMALASLAIVLFIAIAFRNTPPPVSPWSFGITAVLALLHDALVIIGIFSLLGHFFKVEIDSLFVTAVLTAVGFSVHDTIVVFDRIRENLKRYQGSFETIVNDSIAETVARSLSTSLTVIFTLTALLVFGGESIRLFILALLIGILSGTFSSIFNAAPLLVVWHNFKLKRSAKKVSKIK
ncbi:protein translocase subunit SecF [Candidatus Saccharibacteria bacterium]|nr:protein translocase subunit SecF [Candidatus Saccharibacteria bacterium]